MRLKYLELCDKFILTQCNKFVKKKKTTPEGVVFEKSTRFKPKILLCRCGVPQALPGYIGRRHQHSPNIKDFVNGVG